MMQLRDNLWLEGAYYIDFDIHGQLRIAGPNNHLFFGSVGVYRDQIEVSRVEVAEDDQVTIVGQLKASKLFFHDPAIAHMRKVRRYTEQHGKPTPSFVTVMAANPSQISPTYIGTEETAQGTKIFYKRTYQNHWYGVILQLEKSVKVTRHKHKRGFSFEKSAPGPIKFIVTTDTDYRTNTDLKEIIGQADPDLSVLGELEGPIKKILTLSQVEIEHLVRHNKTSGFEYGTVFPRDWMESADLGELDFTPEAIIKMYEKALERVDQHGVGWHEDLVGEHKYENQQDIKGVTTELDSLIDQASFLSKSLKQIIRTLSQHYIDRNMIDIEPHYLLGLQTVDYNRFSPAARRRLRLVAEYVLEQAETNQLITFKKIPVVLRRHVHHEYSSAGNWRDSTHAYKMVHPVIAPYDVNVVFYPEALKIIADHAKDLGVNRKRAERLLIKWERVKEWYRFDNPDGTYAYALALYDVRETEGRLEFKKFAVNHLDESYEFFYRESHKADVLNYCRRLVDPKYFYTPSGPMLVGAREDYATTDYHGKVIWTKQTAYAVAGLYRQLTRIKDWTAGEREMVIRAITKTAEASLNAFIKLQAVPELHYDLAGAPHFFNDQAEAMGPMNMVQLWSAAGARRIINTYISILEYERSLLTTRPRRKDTG